MVVRRMEALDVLGRRLDDAVIEFDRRNMGPILLDRGILFQEEKRRVGFERGGTFMIGFDEIGQIIGYIEYCRDWNCPEEMHVASIQIDKSQRNGVLLRKLLRACWADLSRVEFRTLRAGVHRHNAVAVGMYRRLGFSFKDTPQSAHTFRVWVDRSKILDRIGRLLKGAANSAESTLPAPFNPEGGTR